jgi:hypothetical protein
MRAVVFRGGVAEEQCKPMTLLSSDLQRLAGLSELPLPLREEPPPVSSARANRSDDRRVGSFLTPSPPAEKTTARQQQARQASTGDE